jgi:hypothetical protein
VSDLQAIADRVQIEALRGEATDAAMMRDYDRVQTTHPGIIHLDGDTASGRVYISELVRFHDGRSELNYAMIAAAPDRSHRTVTEEEVT